MKPALMIRVAVGLVLVGVVIWLGSATATAHPSPIMVTLFGIAAALLAPAGLTVLMDALSWRRNKALEELAKAGEVRERAAQAETMEQKLQALEREHERLETIVRFEAQRQMLLTRKEMLKDEARRLTDRARRVTNELTEAERELAVLGGELDQSLVAKDLNAVVERLSQEGASGSKKFWGELRNIDGGLPPHQAVLVRASLTATDALHTRLADRHMRRLAKHARKIGPDQADGGSPIANVGEDNSSAEAASPGEK